MPFIGEKQLVVETIVASQIVPPVFAGPGAPATLTIVSPIMSGSTLTGTTALPAGATVAGGGGTGTAKMIGTLYTAFNGTTGFQVNATAADKIADFYTMPANTLNTAGRMLYVWAWGTHAANTNVATVKLNFNGTGAVNATVTGGTLVGSSGGANVSASGVLVEAWILLQAAAAETYIGQGSFNASATTVTSLLTPPTAITVDMTAAVQINLLINCATTATDMTVNAWGVQIYN